MGSRLLWSSWPKIGLKCTEISTFFDFFRQNPHFWLLFIARGVNSILGLFTGSRKANIIWGSLPCGYYRHPSSAACSLAPSGCRLRRFVGAWPGEFLDQWFSSGVAWRGDPPNPWFSVAQMMRKSDLSSGQFFRPKSVPSISPNKPLSRSGAYFSIGFLARSMVLECGNFKNFVIFAKSHTFLLLFSDFLSIFSIGFATQRKYTSLYFSPPFRLRFL